MNGVKTMSRNAGKGSAWRRNGWRIVGWGTAAIMLLLPLIAMQFTDEVNWDVSDFIIFGAMLATAGGAFELAARMTPNKAYRAAVGVALAAAFFLVWVNGAVGLIGNEGNPANLMYGGVLAVGIIGAVIARRQPKGMARAMVATAVAQVLVPVIALIAGLSNTSGLGNTFVVTGIFFALWLTSAWLFRKSGQYQP